MVLNTEMHEVELFDEKRRSKDLNIIEDKSNHLLAMLLEFGCQITKKTSFDFQN